MRRLSLFALVALALLAAFAAPARADGFIVIVPPEPPAPRPRPLPPRPAYFPLIVRSHHVAVTIEGQVATTEVDEVFANPNPADLEGTYIFPLPEGASVSKFSLFMGGKEVEAEVLDRDRAREIYEGIVRKMRDPALLEYVGRGAMKARIYPIPARGEARVKLAYQQVLAADGGLFEYRYPLSTEKWSAAPLEDVRVEVAIRTKEPIGKVFSPSHEVQVRGQEPDGTVRVTYAAAQVLPDRDFVLYVQKRRSEDPLGLTVITHKPADDDGYFLMLLTPGADLAAEDVPAKDVVFVLDTSGSMAGEKMDQARKALKYCLRALSPRDRFGVIDFSTDVRQWREGLAEASAPSVDAALGYVDAMKARGGTDIHGALMRALAIEGKPGTPFFIVFITDGEPTIGVTDPARIEKAVVEARAARPDRDDVRLFAFGVIGERNELDPGFLDRLAEANRGTREYVGPRESVELKVSRFFDKIAAPVLSNVAIEVPGADISDVYPRPLPDLFRGGEVAIVGRYRGAGPHAVRLRGKIGGRAIETASEARFASGPDAPFLGRVFAVRKVAFLLDQIRLHGESAELRREVVRLAKEFGIVTPYTSYLVAEDARLAMQGPRGGEPGAAARAIEELGRRASGYRDLEREAGLALGAKDKAGLDDASRAAGVSASEALKKMAESPAAPPASPAADAAGAFEARARLAPKGEARGGEEAAKELARAAEDLIRTAGGRTFYREGAMWVDAREGQHSETVRVVYLSAEYFKLLKERPALAPFFALGPALRVTLEGTTFEVVEE
jgi:Ca-activated chloride channel family protein